MGTARSRLCDGTCTRQSLAGGHKVRPYLDRDVDISDSDMSNELKAGRDWRDVASDLNSAAIHLLRGLRVVDRESGLSPARLSALSVLVFGGSMSLGRLARTEGVAGPTMSRLVDGLESEGLARRESHPDNARMTLVSATQEGTSLMREAAERRFDAISDGISRLPAADQDALRHAAPALRRLAAIVREQERG
jgi:DNA-binding MarR family transcriptional regulator